MESDAAAVLSEQRTSRLLKLGHGSRHKITPIYGNLPNLRPGNAYEIKREMKILVRELRHFGVNVVSHKQIQGGTNGMTQIVRVFVGCQEDITMMLNYMCVGQLEDEPSNGVNHGGRPPPFTSHILNKMNGFDYGTAYDFDFGPSPIVSSDERTVTEVSLKFHVSFPVRALDTILRWKQYELDEIEDSSE